MGFVLEKGPMGFSPWALVGLLGLGTWDLGIMRADMGRVGRVLFDGRAEGMWVVVGWERKKMKKRRGDADSLMDGRC